jgi:hypothetical protein
MLSRRVTFAVAAIAVCASYARAQNEAIQAYANMRKFPALFDAKASGDGWPLEWFDPSVRDALSRAALVNSTDERSAILAGLLEEESAGVYSFQLFSPEFCAMFLAEVDNYKASGLPIRRPNSMNRYGLIVNEIGMYDMISVLQAKLLQPIAQYIFPVEGSKFDSHHSFMVQYKQGEDAGLDMHTDDSDVTFNVCLNKNFSGATLTVCGIGGTPEHRIFQQAYVHRMGKCLIHRGHHRHGADDIATGERRNLIVWNTNRAYRGSEQYHREQPYLKEQGPPDPRCLSYTHDRDYAAFKQYPTGPTTKEARKKAWCPPQTACYDSMEPARTLTAQRLRDTQTRQDL